MIKEVQQQVKENKENNNLQVMYIKQLFIDYKIWIGSATRIAAKGYKAVEKTQEES